MATLSGWSVAIDVLQPQFAFTDANAIITGATGTTLTVATPSGRTQVLTGTFIYNASGIGAGSEINGIAEYAGGTLLYQISNAFLPIQAWASFVSTSNAAGQRHYIFFGDDNIFGTAGNDRLGGFNGRDTIDGGDGSDIAYFTGNRANYSVSKSNGQVTVTTLNGSDGTDTLTNVEWLQFADMTIAANITTQVVASDHTPGHNATSVFLNTFVGFFDGDGDALTQIEIFDNTTGNGAFRRNGVLQAEHQSIIFTPAEFASYDFVTDATGANSISIRAFDGYGWGAWQTFNINARANALPAITAPNLTPGKNDAFITGAALFGAADGDGDTITRYKFYDGTAGNGRFLLNGAAQVELANFEIDASDLANFGFETSAAGASTLWVQAYDGISWGTWKSFTVAAQANVAPVASVQNLAPAKGTAFIASSSLLTVSDPDDANVIRYRFFDGTAGNGVFQLNGVDQVELQNITVEAADFASFRFRTATSGSDVLWAQAYDGTAWGAWKTFTVAAPVNVAPTVNVQMLSPAKSDTFISGAALFTVTDPDDATMAKYRFFDGTAGNGRFSLSGNLQVELANIEINAGDLANFRYVTSTTGSGDTLWVQAYDGFAWGAWKSFMVNAPVNVAPTVNAQNVSPSRTAAFIAGSALFTVTDPDDAGMTKYRFFDGTAGNGRFQLNGADQLELANIEINASDLAGFRYVTSTTGVGDTLWVQAYDGFAWGAWKSFTAAAPVNNAPQAFTTDLHFTRSDVSRPAANLLGWGDPDGDSITRFRFFDGTAGNGYFTLNGVQQAANVNIEVLATDLAGMNFVLGANRGASDQLWVQLYDGMTWSAWKTFTVSKAANSAPVVDALSGSPQKGRLSLTAASLCWTTDAENDPITRFRFFDGTIGNGHFALNGVQQTAQANIEVTAAQIADLHFVFGLAQGATDQLWVQVYDGFDWSAWKSFSVSTPVNAVPVVNVRNITPAQQTFVAGSALFTVTDSDDNFMTSYRFFDATAGNGYFTLNGVQQATLANIEITHQQLADFDYRTSTTGAGDTLWVQVFDGYDWSSWKNFTVAAPQSDGPVFYVEDLVYDITPNYLPASALFVAADPSDVVRYRFYDSEIGGRFRLNGVDQQEQRNIEIDAADLPNLIYMTSMGGRETIWMQAFDGVAWSEWQTFEARSVTYGVSGSWTILVTPPMWGAPDVTATNAVTQAGSSISLDQLLSATDPDGDAIAEWHIRNTSPTRGTLTLNGVAQTSFQVDLMANQLAALDWNSSATGFARLWASATDVNGASSEWKPFIINTLAPT